MFSSAGGNHARPSPIVVKNIDELSKAEIDVLFEESNQELDKLEARWEGLAQTAR